MVEGGYTDPEELPFTHQELYEAHLRLSLSSEEAKRAADHLAECGPGLIELRDQRRANWRSAGIPNADKILLNGWEYPPEMLSALSSLSPPVADRVRELEKRLARMLNE